MHEVALGHGADIRAGRVAPDDRRRPGSRGDHAARLSVCLSVIDKCDGALWPATGSNFASPFIPGSVSLEDPMACPCFSSTPWVGLRPGC
ncbi:hypothetical protein VFPFJ_08377 [Purpureocillium lilacinum]|uniref:Uncharacterized protein n=1 Tax=Purpureocillium lilacinum TaxID=33203 RepID=A0A179GXF0_PURLI|nr:hypothetical protein VFPFJ_08377 [Purpureocillium lilacinum]OAQ82574.1 hypothetical protein VFPFJ_08377 [Purpureocillium lilacinum]